MALKGDRVEHLTDIRRTCGDVAERGVVLIYGTSGSGVALGDSAGTATLATNPSGGVPAGMLMNDIVNIDQTKYKLNEHKDQHQIGQRCRLLRKGRVTTNKITGSPAQGQVAYLTTSGNLTPTVSTTGGVVATPPVGEFDGSKDADGYVTVNIELPYTS